MKTQKHTRSVLPRAALPRILFLDKEIASGKYPSTGKLAAQYEVSSATITRDIAFMKNFMDAPITYNAARRGYYYSEPNFRIKSGGFSSAEDLLALGMAKNILDMYRNTPFYEAARDLLDCITAPLASEGNAGWYENRIVVPPVPSAPLVPEIWEPVISALRENRVLAFEYQGLWDEGYEPRRVRPYQLLFDTGVWYLYGYAEERKDIRVFFLQRIRNITLTGDRFALPKNFDYRLDNGGSFFGVFAGHEKMRFKVGFYANSVLWVQERLWAVDQKIEETDDGVVISFSSTQYDKVLEWILSRGCTAQPFAPEKLVRDWQWHIDEMTKLAQAGARKES
jgi:predicted DNA-binding transcriptional regulator YafY